MKLHLGCGKLKLNTFVNIDLLSDIADLKLILQNYKYLILQYRRNIYIYLMH